MSISVSDVANVACEVASPTSTLWGIDEDDAQLFSIGDYRGDVAGTFTDYGSLFWTDDGGTTTAPILDGLESFAIDFAYVDLFTNGLQTNIAYFATDEPLGIHAAPVLLKIDLATVVPGGPNVATVIGTIQTPGDFPFGDDHDISGLAIDPESGELLALHRDGGGSTPDRIHRVSKITGNLLIDYGPVTGPGGAIVGKGEEIEVGTESVIYVADNQDDNLYTVALDPVTPSATITGLVDDLTNGPSGASVKMEGLAYDTTTGELVGADQLLLVDILISFVNGGITNVLLADLTALGLTDVEGIDFVAGIRDEIPNGEFECGLGVELVLVLPVVAWVIRRRRAQEM